jgi:trehalose/maltose hydrolase-like predicted phosphorylase
MPFLTYTMPRIARNLLSFRAGFLDKARMRAREGNQKGALFPWRTINGEEASAYYAAGTAQYHINADIIQALKKYVDATGDEEFLQGTGAELLVETARLWRDLGFFSKRRKGQFCINGVTGPDEYNTVVNNNTYTNMMALENLRYAADTLAPIRWRASRRRIRSGSRSWSTRSTCRSRRSGNGGKPRRRCASPSTTSWGSTLRTTTSWKRSRGIWRTRRQRSSPSSSTTTRW